jgi:serine/threonine-protein kinase
VSDETIQQARTIGGLGPTVRPVEREDTSPHGLPAISPATVERYERVRVIATGGAGEVAECIDTLLERRVASKTATGGAGVALPDQLLANEARIISSLEHPNIIPVYDAGTHADGKRFYIMRLVDQPTLREVIDELDSNESPGTVYPLGRRMRHFIQVCNAVEYAHSRGIIHCDLKPANILLGEFGEVFVADWGLAHALGASSGPRGGTPGYMAPEQLDPDPAAITAQTDVFALGAILYEMLCLRAAMSGTTEEIVRRLKHAWQGSITELSVPEAPADTPAPPELLRVCARAMQVEPARRHPNARALAAAVEEVIEGTKERRRRQREAERHVAEGEELAERYREFIDQRSEQRERIRKLAAAIAPWAGAREKKALWSSEDLVAVTESLRVRTLQTAVAEFEAALDLVEDEPRAQRGLAALYRSELELARERRDELDALYFAGLVLQYDDSGCVDSGVGQLRLRGTEGAPELSIELVKERMRRWVRSGDRRMLSRGIESIDLSPGRYAIDVERDGHLVTTPVLIQPGRTTEIELCPPVSALGSDERVVSGGAALLGCDSVTGQPTEIHVPGFIICRFPVTFAEYLRFARVMIERDPRAAELHLPKSRDGRIYWSLEAGQWRPASFPGELGTDPMTLPAFGIDALSAQSYALWRSHGQPFDYRLPTALEWEKAARGTDGRAFPWGERFDAGFCKMRDSRPGLPVPEPVGTFDADESPYGVRDMAGGIAEWVTADEPGEPTSPEMERLSSRGGAWCDWPSDCHAAAGRPYFALERSARLGFRLARDLA